MKHALQGLPKRVVAAVPAARDDEPGCSSAARLARVIDPPPNSEILSVSQRSPRDSLGVALQQRDPWLPPMPQVRGS